MQKWEYKVVHCFRMDVITSYKDADILDVGGGKVEAVLSKLGHDGWKMTNTVGISNKPIYVVFLERAVQ
jgi:hypothetical protein